MTSQDFPLPIYPFPHHMLPVHRNIPDLLRTVHQPWLEFEEEQFDHHLFSPSLSEALGTWNSNVSVFCHKQKLLKSCQLGYGYPHVYQNYIHKIAVILHDTLQGETHKPFGTFTSVNDCSYYVCKYGHIHHSDCRNTLIYTHTTSCTLPTCDISLGSLMLPAPEAGDFVEINTPAKLSISIKTVLF